MPDVPFSKPRAPTASKLHPPAPGGPHLSRPFLDEPEFGNDDNDFDDGDMGGGFDDNDDFGMADGDAAENNVAVRRSARVAAGPAVTLAREDARAADAQDPWAPLDPHDDKHSGEVHAPFKKLTSYKVRWARVWRQALLLRPGSFWLSLLVVVLLLLFIFPPLPCIPSPLTVAPVAGLPSHVDLFLPA